MSEAASTNPAQHASFAIEQGTKALLDNLENALRHG